MLKPLRLTSPTPIGELDTLDSPVRIFIKRDDLNGLVISGNKARKLEYLAADAKRKDCDTLITCGGEQSNHCRTTAAFAKYFGFDCHLLLRIRGKPKRIYTGNLLIDRLFDATIRSLTPSQYEQREEVMKRYAAGLKKRGKKPYLIPEGGSNEIGILGYRDCMMEMAKFIKKERIDAIYCAVGSGGTYAGLLLGKKSLGLAVDLNGILVSDTVPYFTEKITTMCATALREHKIKASIADRDITLVDGYIGKGYGIPYPAEMKTIRTLARSGIILEPVYTGKTFHGMLQHLKTQSYKKVIFMHTGGIFSIFGFAKEYTRILRTREAWL
jgi:D-cysteine desulfhydrase